MNKKQFLNDFDKRIIGIRQSIVDHMEGNNSFWGPGNSLAQYDDCKISIEFRIDKVVYGTMVSVITIKDSNQKTYNALTGKY